MDIHAVLENTVQRHGSRTALVFKDEEITFAQLREQVHKLANALKAIGLGKGDKIAFYLPNGPEYVYSYLACFHLGCVGVPLDFMLKMDEIASCLEHSEAKVLVAAAGKDVDLMALKERVPSLKTIILCRDKMEGAYSFEEIVSQAPAAWEPIEINDNDPALIMYTSGTTGRPKGILLNYRHLDGSPEAMKHFVDLSDQDIKLAAIPLSHIGGFIYVQNCIVYGIKLILMERFHPMEFLENVARHKVTCFHIVPAMYNAILTLKQIEKFDLSSLRWVVVFGAPSSPEILERFHKHCPNARLLNGWGMTETCPPNTVTPMESDNIASVGKPAPHCEIKVVDDEGQEVRAGAVGEVVIRGWVVMDGYYKDPDATSTAIKDGWLHTGDLGRFDQNGFLYIVGRKKEMIKVGGQIVYAPEVEAVLYKHEEVAEAAVIGVLDQMKGEAVKAFVVLKEGSRLKSEDLRHFARGHLANFKVPQSIELLNALPKNRTGKIDKEALKQKVLT